LCGKNGYIVQRNYVICELFFDEAQHGEVIEH